MAQEMLEFEGVLGEAQCFYEMIMATGKLTDIMTLMFTEHGLQWYALCDDDTIWLSAGIDRAVWREYHYTHNPMTKGPWRVRVFVNKLLACFEKCPVRADTQVRLEVSCGARWIYCGVQSGEILTEVNMVVTHGDEVAVENAEYEGEWIIASGTLLGMLSWMSRSCDICYVGVVEVTQNTAELQMNTPRKGKLCKDEAQCTYAETGNTVRRIQGQTDTNGWVARLRCSVTQLQKMASAGHYVSTVKVCVLYKILCECVIRSQDLCHEDRTTTGPPRPIAL